METSYEKRILQVALTAPVVRMYVVEIYIDQGGLHHWWAPIVVIQAILYDEYRKSGDYYCVPPNAEEDGWQWDGQGTTRTLLYWDDSEKSLSPVGEEACNSKQGVAVCPWPYNEEEDAAARARVMKDMEPDLREKLLKWEKKKSDRIKTEQKPAQ